ncbi:hypothetical protein KY285_014301 [Solanum tuberosum]|nr:hypothetical protein KY285_014301 [Solanum tuberosum]
MDGERQQEEKGGCVCSFPDDSTVHTDTSTVMSLEEHDHDQLVDSPRTVHGAGTEIELQPPTTVTEDHHSLTLQVVLVLLSFDPVPLFLPQLPQVF